MHIPTKVYVVADKHGKVTSDLIIDYSDAIALARAQVSITTKTEQHKVTVCAINNEERIILEYHIKVATT